MHGINPTSLYVLVEPAFVEEKTTGGIILPEQIKEKDEWAQTRGVLIATGPVAFEFDDWPEGAMKPAIGQTVSFARYSGTTLKGNDGKDYWVMKDRDIMTTIESE